MAVSPDPPRPGLRVLWLTTVADTDGPGRAMLAVVNRWLPDDVVGICALRGVTPAFRRECRPGVETHDVAMRGAWDMAALGRVIRLCRRWRPDVIHTQLSRADWIGRPLGRALGVPVISTIHNVHSRMYRGEFSPLVARLGLACDRLSAPFAARFVAVSAGVGRDLEAHGVPGNRIAVIHNGLSLDRRAPLSSRDDVRRAWDASPEDIVIGTVALCKRQKGLEYLVEAARTAAAADPRLRFVHVGDGPRRDELARQVTAAGLDGRFTLAGRVPDPMQVLSGFDAFVLASLWEGLPIALLEAMSAGLPAIGTAVTGIEDVIEHERSGLLVAPADPGALANAILRIASSAVLRERLGAGALRRLQQFTSDSVAGRYRDVTLEVVAPGVPQSVPVDAPRVRPASNL